MALERRRELIERALQRRLRELWDSSIARLRPSDFGAHAAFVQELQAQAPPPSGTSPATYEARATDDAASGWTLWEGDCLEALRRLSLGKELPVYRSTAPPVEPFMASLSAARRNPDERFRLLVERYASPMNVTLDQELYVREHLLERLMVQDRAQIEGGRIEAASLDDLLLKLNLVAVYAIQADDLRYLDALNYYYEILPEGFRPEACASLLFANYLGLYARALSAWLEQKL